MDDFKYMGGMDDEFKPQPPAAEVGPVPQQVRQVPPVGGYYPQPYHAVVPQAENSPAPLPLQQPQRFPAAVPAAIQVPAYSPAAPVRQPAAKSTKKKRKKSSRGAFAAAVLCSAVAFSAVFGVGGAYLGYRYFGATAVPDNAGAVYYQSVPQSDAKTTQTAAGSTGLDVAAVAAAVQNSVVAISTESVTGNGRFSQMVTTGAGSGVILSTDGYIVTNNHVIDGARKITVRLQSGKEYEAELIGSDEKSDLAVLKIEAEGLTAAVMGNSADLVVGEPAVAIGNPLGELGGTVTEGIISALDREVTIDGETMTLLQTSAAINPGNSGGGLFNARGELIGVVNAKSSGTGIEGLGFAIPIDAAKSVITDLTEHGYVTGRVAAPFTLVEVSDYLSALQYRVSETGLYIAASTDSQFERGDRITEVDGAQIATEADFTQALAGKLPGDKLKITVVRDGESKSYTLTLQEEH